MRTLSRREFSLGFAASVNGPPSLVTLEHWLDAKPAAREKEIRALLKRIRVDDERIHAWVRTGIKHALGAGPLNGIPFGVKDIIDTADFATEWGSAVFRGRRPKTDAWIVTQFRTRGAVMIGKTHTAAFAMRVPPPTRNPRNLEHTPGGSSSGSAAAVAAGMVPVAIGTQTGGSVIRPASFCGVVGFKPTHGLLSTAGVLTYAASLDTLGFFTHTPEGMLRLWEALGHPTGRNEEHAFAVPDPIPEVDPDMRTAFIAAIARLRAGGVNIAPTGISARLIHLTVLQRTVADYEGTREHRQRVEKYGERLGEPANLVRRGTEISESRYREALESVNRERAWFDEQFRRTPVILTPAAPGPAPRTLASTGDHRMNSPWTLLGTPAATIPMGETGGLPLGLQLTAARGGDAVVLHAASRLATVLRS